MTNPLLNQDGLPSFSSIRTSHVEPAIDQILAENRRLVKALLASKDNPSWRSFVEPFEVAEDRLQRVWAPVSHMNAVVNSDELRSAYNACLPKLSEYGTEMGQNEALYQAYKTLSENCEELEQDQVKVLENALRDFHLSGVDLPQADKARFKEISRQLSQLTSRFEENLGHSPLLFYH